MKAKKIWIILFVMCAAVLSLVSCSSDDDNNVYEAAELGGTWQKVYDEGVADAGTVQYTFRPQSANNGTVDIFLGSRRHHRLSYLHRHQCWASADFSQAR